MFEFYFAKGTIALASLIALEETGAEYRLISVDFSKNQQQSEDYLAKNPKGRVPLLITERGAISETPAILTYIASEFPEHHLAPTGHYDYAKMQEYLSYFASTFHVNHAHKLRGYRWSDDEASWEHMRSKVAETMNASATYVENLLADPYLLGAYCVADMHLFAIARWFEGDGVEIGDYPKLNAWWRRMHAREAVQRALEIADNL